MYIKSILCVCDMDICIFFCHPYTYVEIGIISFEYIIHSRYLRNVRYTHTMFMCLQTLETLIFSYAIRSINRLEMIKFISSKRNYFSSTLKKKTKYIHIIALYAESYALRRIYCIYINYDL